MARRQKSFRDKIIDQVMRWDPAQLQAEATSEKELFVNEGIARGRYADEGVYGATYGSFMALQKGAIRHACAGDEPFARLLVESACMYFLDLRFSKACLRETEGRADYVRMLRELIAQADLSLLLKLEPQAEWMYREYLDNPAETLSGADYVDPELDALTRLTAALWLEGEAALSLPNMDAFGVYGPLVESLSAHRLDADSLNRFIDERQTQAAWRYVEDADGVGLTFFGDMFAALFPVEILALVRAYAKHRPIELEINDSFGARLFQVQGSSTMPEESFFRAGEQFVRGLEAKQGLKAPPLTT